VEGRVPRRPAGSYRSHAIAAPALAGAASRACVSPADTPRLQSRSGAIGRPRLREVAHA
jgi:hypothetical protein